MGYQVIGNAKSRARRVIWLLEELGAPYEYVLANPRSPEVFALNPLGKIPVLKDGDTILADSTAILIYLADKHNALTHAPGTVERAVQDGHLFFVLDEFDALLWLAAKHSFILPEDQRVPELKPRLRQEFVQSCARLGARIAGPFLQGEQMTIADIVAGHCLDWAASAKFEIDDQNVLAYQARLRDQAAYKKAQAL